MFYENNCVGSGGLRSFGHCPRFDDFMRAESVPDGQKITPLTKAEDAEIMREHAHAVIYAEPSGNDPRGFVARLHCVTPRK